MNERLAKRNEGWELKEIVREGHALRNRTTIYNYAIWSTRLLVEINRLSYSILYLVLMKKVNTCYQFFRGCNRTIGYSSIKL